MKLNTTPAKKKHNAMNGQRNLTLWRTTASILQNFQ